MRSFNENLPSNAIVSTKGLQVYQGEHIILKDVNIDIKKGEFVFLVGRTGSGKSSFLKVLYADLAPYKGKVIVAGVNVTRKITQKRVSLLRRQLGIVFQDFQLLLDRNVIENLMFVMRATGWKDKRKMKLRALETLQMVGLAASDYKMPYHLSGGEQQRLAIARALLNDPVLIIADEPTGNLDPVVSKEIFKLFFRINAKGTAVLMATHNHNLIERTEERVLKCEDGKILDSLKDDFYLRTYY